MEEGDQSSPEQSEEEELKCNEQDIINEEAALNGTLGALRSESSRKYNSQGLPKRQGFDQCIRFMRIGECKFISNCIFDHPEIIYPGSSFNSLGFPLRENVPDCESYIIDRTCKFGCVCNKNHPENITPQAIPSKAQSLTFPPPEPEEDTEPIYMEEEQTPRSKMPVATFHIPIEEPQSLPRNPGLPVCRAYARGELCRFGPRCKFDHPLLKEELESPKKSISLAIGQPPATPAPESMDTTPISNTIQEDDDDEFVPYPIDDEVEEPTIQSHELKSNDFLEEEEDSYIISASPKTTTSADGIIYPIRPGKNPCFAYQRSGSCWNGENCQFDHSLGPSLGKFQPLAKPQNQQPQKQQRAPGPYSMKRTIQPLAAPDPRLHPVSGLPPIPPKGCLPSKGGLPFKGGLPAKAGYPLKGGLPPRPGLPPKAVLPPRPPLVGGLPRVQPLLGLPVVQPQVATPLPAQPPQATEVPPNPNASRGLNSKELPLRPGIAPCPHFVRFGTCNYGVGCKWDHPEEYCHPKLGQATVPDPAPAPAIVMKVKGLQQNKNILSIRDSDNSLNAADPFAPIPQIQFGWEQQPPADLPRRPHMGPCDFYMKTGNCKFGMTCKWDHPERNIPQDKDLELITTTEVASVEDTEEINIPVHKGPRNLKPMAPPTRATPY